jgi:hypothetical protein
MQPVSQPDPDPGDVDRALVYEVTLAGGGRDGTELVELAEAALDGVALVAACGVEGGRAASSNGMNCGQSPCWPG